MAYLPFIRLFKKGDPARLVSNVQDHNRIGNIVNDLQGVGCRIDKPVNGEGRGWRIIVGDGTSDIQTTDLDPDFTPPDYKEIKIITDDLGGGYDSRGINETFWGISDSASYDATLDDTEDYRGRIIECCVKQIPSATDSAELTAGDDWVTTIVIPSPASDVTIGADSPYSVYVDSGDGSLHLAASAADTDYAVVWIRTSALFGVPGTCPWTYPSDQHPEEYTVSGAFASTHSGGTILWQWDDGSDWVEVRVKSGSATVTPTSACNWKASPDEVTFEGATGTGNGAGTPGKINYPSHPCSDGDIIFIIIQDGSGADGTLEGWNFYKVYNAGADDFELEIIDNTFGGNIAEWFGDYDDLDIVTYSNHPCEERSIDDTTWRGSPGEITLALGSGKWECGVSATANALNYAGLVGSEIPGEKPIGGSPLGNYEASNTNEDASATVTAA